mmetsp:Transcript_13967/g.25805  ORF Transcript_13967/g.25805 Transcript_13967/m.25805 type:complete len:719 (-) Transcript_13967:224-2380(-)
MCSAFAVPSRSSTSDHHVRVLHKDQATSTSKLISVKGGPFGLEACRGPLAPFPLQQPLVACPQAYAPPPGRPPPLPPVLPPQVGLLDGFSFPQLQPLSSGGLQPPPGLNPLRSPMPQVMPFASPNASAFAPPAQPALGGSFVFPPLPPPYWQNPASPAPPPAPSAGWPVADGTGVHAKTMCDGWAPILDGRAVDGPLHHSASLDTSGGEGHAAPAPPSAPKPSGLGCFNDAELNRLIDAAHARLYPPERPGCAWAEPSIDHSWHQRTCASASDTAQPAEALAACIGAGCCSSTSGVQPSREPSSVEGHPSMCSIPWQSRGDTADVPEWQPIGADLSSSTSLQQVAAAPKTDRRGLAQATAAAAAAAAAAIAVTGGDVAAPESEELANMRAETERLQQLLAELLAKEAATGHLPDSAGRHVAAAGPASAPPTAVATQAAATTIVAEQPQPKLAESPHVDTTLQPGDEPSEIEPIETMGGSLYSSTLLSTARAHAENRKLERDLRKLREVVNAQRGEASWLLEGLQKHVAASEPSGRASNHRAHEAHVRLPRETAEAESAECRRRGQVLRNPWEYADDQHREPRASVSRRYAEGMQGSTAEAEPDDEHGFLEWNSGAPVAVPKAVPARAVTSPNGRGVVHAARAVEPPAVRAPPVEERSAADPVSASPSMVDAAVAACVENRRLRRELQGLRALAQWQQGEVGMMAASEQEAVLQRHSGR